MVDVVSLVHRRPIVTNYKALRQENVEAFPLLTRHIRLLYPCCVDYLCVKGDSMETIRYLTQWNRLSLCYRDNLWLFERHSYRGSHEGFQ